jgi:sugar phosphate isomerase/epimerase
VIVPIVSSTSQRNPAFRENAIMQNYLHRRTFLKTTAAAGAGLCLTGLSGRARGADSVVVSTPAAEEMGWHLAVQLYTFRRFTFYEALEMIAGVGVKRVEPCFFLPLSKEHPGAKTGPSLSPALRKEMKANMAGRGITMPSFYADLGADGAANRKTFEFARGMGAQTIVAEPPAEAFDGIEKLCEEFLINLAVHNHPESPKSKYWRPENVLAVCEGRGKRIGACCDTGHWVRSGLDPVESLKKLEGRIISIHLKDVVESGNPKARDVPLGTGNGNYASVLKELHRQGFKGVMSVEYEHDSEKLVADVAQCLAFVEKTVKGF